MASFTLMWVSVLVTELMLYGYASGLLWKTKMTPSQSETGDVGSVEKSLVKRPALRDRGLRHAFGVNLLRRERRQNLQRPVSDQNVPLFNHLSDHGTFNQDTALCDDILWRSCWSPSDCEGCLGLFTCHLSQGACYFKGVSSNTGNFYQSLGGDQEDHVDPR
ncbi:uncharacterized protein LOC143960559 [Lithobates pipiens]